MSQFKLIGLSGSLRKASTNVGLLRKAKEMGHKHGLDIRILSCDIPLYNQDLEGQGWPPSEAPIPQVVKDLRTAISEADGLLFAVEEFNWSVSGVLKNTIDWVSRAYDGQPSPLKGKVAGMVGAGGFMGTARSQMALRPILVEADVLAMPKPELTVNRFTPGQFDDQGVPIDPALLERLDKYLAALAVFCAAHGPKN